jgi:hypothetical protein
LLTGRGGGHHNAMILMGLFGSASSKQVDEFAKGLARELARACPPEKDADTGKGKPKVTAGKLTAAVDDICRQAVQYREQHKLGIYKKARLGNTFRWELKELGYEEAFVENVTQRLVVQIAHRPKK